MKGSEGEAPSRHEKRTIRNDALLRERVRNKDRKRKGRKGIRGEREREEKKKGKKRRMECASFMGVLARCPRLTYALSVCPWKTGNRVRITAASVCSA